MVAAALIALNLAAATETWRSYPRPPLYHLAFSYSNSNSFTSNQPDGSTEDGAEDLETGYRRTMHIKTQPPRPTIIQIWSPIIVSGSLTVLALFLISARKFPEESAVSVAHVRALRMPSPLDAVRGLALVGAIVGLNVVGATSTLTHHPSTLGLRPTARGEGGRYIQYKIDGSVDYILEDFGGTLPAACRDGGWFIRYNLDGSVDYFLKDRGTGYRRTIRTEWRRPPLPTPQEVWFPVIASVATSVIVASIVLTKRTRKTYPQFTAWECLGNRRGLPSPSG